jgi:hypothetical protein
MKIILWRTAQAAYAGQAVVLKFTGSEDYTKQTSFVLDDTAINVS